MRGGLLLPFKGEGRGIFHCCSLYWAGLGPENGIPALHAGRQLPEAGRRYPALVPEQYTFETEKAMLHLAGPVGANAVSVYSFYPLGRGRLPQEGGAGAQAQRGGRRILMSIAVEECQDRLEVYGAAAKKRAHHRGDAHRSQRG